MLFEAISFLLICAEGRQTLVLKFINDLVICHRIDLLFFLLVDSVLDLLGLA